MVNVPPPSPDAEPNEAMAFGLPIITTKVAGCSVLVQGNGRIVSPTMHLP